MSNKKNVAILFGGKSTEHEVSLQSAKSIFKEIDKEKYNLICLGINKEGKWLLINNPESFFDKENLSLSDKEDNFVILIPGSGGDLYSFLSKDIVFKVDVVFPILHGTLGEDGAIQGLLRNVDVPFVGADVLGSAVGMDKEFMKRLLKEERIPVGKFIVVGSKDLLIDFKKVKEKLGLPFFVKPASLGSSVGINKVYKKEDYLKAVKDAFKYDNKMIIEEYIKGREIECSVLGNSNPIASFLGEVKPLHDFYSYKAKYIDEKGAELKIPAEISFEKTEEIQKLAVKTFKSLSCKGFARVDFFLKEDGEIFVNEINTIPGFTKISMYPKLWEISGIYYSRLIDELIELALEKDSKKETDFVL